MPPRAGDIHSVLAICPGQADVKLLNTALQSLHVDSPEAVTLLVSPGSQVPAWPWAQLVHPALDDATPWSAAIVHDLVAVIKACQADVAVLITHASQSPYPLAYACYLAGVPRRLGQSQEFGGSLLTDWVPASISPQDSTLIEGLSVGI